MNEMKNSFFNKISTGLTILLFGAAFNVTAAQNPTRIVNLDSSGGWSKGKIMIVQSADSQNIQGVELFANVTLGCPGGDIAYGLYMWTEKYGRTRLSTMCPGDFSSRLRFAPPVVNDTILLTDNICFEVWTEHDDGVDAPDSGSDYMVLRGEDGDGYPCTDLK